jgi:hypothetical protein
LKRFLFYSYKGFFRKLTKETVVVDTNKLHDTCRCWELELNIKYETAFDDLNNLTNNMQQFYKFIT